MPPKARLLTVLVVLSAGAIGGYIFRLLHLPLPWTLGAMFSAAMLSLISRDLVLPPIFRDGARPIIGVVAGSAFTPIVVGTIAGWWPLIPTLTLFFLLVTASGFWFFRSRGYDPQTALFASMPGGLGEMTLLGVQFDADVKKLVLVHTVRIVVVVSVVPFLLTQMTHVNLSRPQLGVPHGGGVAGFDWLILASCGIAGYFLGRPVRAYGGIMIAPMLLSAFAHGTGVTTAAPPEWLVAAMQVIIGCITGSRFAGIKFKEAQVSLIEGFFWTLILIAISFAAASLTSVLVDRSLAALFLAYSPGGFAEMSVIAFAANIEAAFVVTCHVFRTIYVVLFGPVLCNLVLNRRR